MDEADLKYSDESADTITVINQRFEKNSFIILTYEYYFMHHFVINDGIGRTIFTSEKNAIYTRLYRTLCSIYAFLNMEAKNKNVIGEMKKFDRSRISYIPTIL